MSRPRRPGLGGDRGGTSLGASLAGLVRSVIGLALIGGLIYFFYVPLFGPKQPAPALDSPQGAAPSQSVVPPVASAPTPTAPPASSTPGTSGTTGTVELTTTASIQKQQLTVAKFNQKQLIGIHAEVRRALDEWEKEQLAWEQEGPQLLKNEVGKRIASDTTQVKAFRGAFRHDRPTSDELATARQLADDLIAPIKEAISNAEDASTPAEAITSNLRSIQTQARKARDSYRESRDAVRAMLAKARTRPPGEKTLGEAMATLDQEEANARAAIIDDARKKEQDKGAKQVADEKARLAKELAEAEAARIKGEADRTKQQAEMAAAKRKQEAQLAAAKTIEEMTKKQKETEAEIARLRDLAEQQRQGDLKAGSVWKGNFTVSGNEFEGTMTIESRVKDKLRGAIVYRRIGERGSLSFTGTVNGTSVKLTPTDGEPASNVYECVYQPATKTISGQSTYKAFSFRLSEEKDE